MAQRIYRRRVVGWKGLSLPIVLWIAAAAWLYHVAPGGLTAFNVVVAILASGAIFGIWLLTVCSVNVYGTTTITTEAMRVGRTTVPLAVLDREWILALAQVEAPAGFERFARSAGTLQVGELSTLNQAQGRLIGGAYGVPLGADSMTLRKVNGEMITMPVKDRARALGALLEALAQQPGD